MPTPREDPGAAPVGRISRRAFLGAAIGAIVLAVGAGTTLLVTSLRGSGKLVDALLTSKPFYAAHRGGSADWPEMSLEGYRDSVGHGVDALEISLARTSDGVWFGLHDATLDRTSGTSGFVASEHTWAEVDRYRISAKDTTNPTQAAQPYLRFSELIDAYAATHTIFVDPKSVDHRFYPELLGILHAGVPNPRQTFVAKFYCTGTDWATAARNDGYRTWGFYYGTEVDADPTLLPRTEQSWDLLGMDYTASDAAWTAVLGYRKLVIAHIVPNKHAAATALRQGATGMMVSGVTEVLG